MGEALSGVSWRFSLFLSLAQLLLAYNLPDKSNLKFYANLKEDDMRRLHLLTTLLTIAASLLCFGTTAAAQQQSQPGSATPAAATAAAKPPPQPCRNAQEYRQLDFWVGEWEVQTPQGKPAGTSSVQLILKDCVVFENWTGVRGYTGKSFNLYNTQTRKWQQIWVDDQGGILHFAGEFRDGAMRYTGESMAADGKPIRDRLTFTPLAEGRVRQLWEQSSDDGKTWKTVFDGTYIKKK